MPDRCEFMDLPELIGDYNGNNGIFLAVDGPLLERRERLTPVHGDRVRAHSLKGIDEYGRADNAHLQAIHVLRSLHCLFAVRQFPVTIFSPAEPHNAFLLDDLEEAFSDLSVLHGIKGFVIRKEERHGEEVKLLHCC